MSPPLHLVPSCGEPAPSPPADEGNACAVPPLTEAEADELARRRLSMATSGTWPLAKGLLRTCHGCGAHVAHLGGGDGDEPCPRCLALLRSPELVAEEREEILILLVHGRALVAEAEMRRARLERLLERGTP